ncbi:protein-export chaperone SecB [Paenibacillus sp. GP183]|uniref:protein-export chaperone SecB n=1 Tax=Paenibacillus sp. GP183 TaxID=1882751 RepID=UPI00089D6077|nr:protein-export chaperone SecB [Paenibacillus sp. GP183]SEC41144.1 protein translocase subunit secB [Paenibacillus sp. GP183]
MEKEIVPSSFTFDEYIINKSNFEVNQDFMQTDNINLDFKLNTDFQVNEENDRALIILICEVFNGFKEKNYPFNLYIEIVGKFSLNGEVDVEFANLCKVNGTAILFPYLRAYISFVTSMSGMPNLILPTVNVLKMLEEQ